MGRKKAVFKGAWYPETSDECESHIKGYLKDNKGIIEDDSPGCIVPHAGWNYSGSIACRTIGSLASQLDQGRNLDCIVIFGLHMKGEDTPIILESGTWETPFGDLEIERNFGNQIVEQAIIEKVKILKQPSRLFPEENTIELQLPFIKYFFSDIPIVTIGVPPNNDALTIGKAVYNAAKDLKMDIAVMGSTDLTHYGESFGFTPVGSGDQAYEWVKNKNDAMAVKALRLMDAEEILNTGKNNHNMCCPGAAAAAVTTSKLLGATKGMELEYASSYNKAPGDSFVGYTGVLFQTTLSLL